MQINTSQLRGAGGANGLQGMSGPPPGGMPPGGPPPGGMPPGGMPPGGPASSAAFSRGANMQSKLSELKSSDPEALKTKASEIADELEKTAKDAGEEGGKALTQLASAFRKVAETGDLEALKPPSGGPPKSFASGAAGATAGKAPTFHGPSSELKSAMDSAMSMIESKLAG